MNRYLKKEPLRSRKRELFEDFKSADKTASPMNASNVARVLLHWQHQTQARCRGSLAAFRGAQHPARSSLGRRRPSLPRLALGRPASPSNNGPAVQHARHRHVLRIASSLCHTCRRCRSDDVEIAACVTNLKLCTKTQKSLVFE